MNGYLLDTNILSELRKGSRASENVRLWFDSVNEQELYISVLVIGEIRRGIERARRSDVPKAVQLEKWLNELEAKFESRLLPVTTAIADRWGCVTSGQPVSAIDGLLAATALQHDLVLVTRNQSDVASTGVAYLNPFV